jgi:hypothetical protein
MNQNSRVLATFLAAFIALALLGPTSACGWGFEGHRMILRMAIDLMPPGERATLLGEENLTVLERNVLLPDQVAGLERKQKRPPVEGSRHYLNLEKMGKATDLDSFRKCLENQGLKTGRLVQSIHETEGWLRRAALGGHRSEWLRRAGYLAHYIGDAHQPLHTTDNHDGRATDNVFDLDDPEGVSVHIRYESGLLNHYTKELEQQARDLVAIHLSEHGGLQGEMDRYLADPAGYVAGFVWKTHQHVAAVLDADNKLTGRRPNFPMQSGKYYEKLNSVLGQMTAVQLAQAAIATAAMWKAAAPSGEQADKTWMFSR